MGQTIIKLFGPSGDLGPTPTGLQSMKIFAHSIPGFAGAQICSVLSLIKRYAPVVRGTDWGIGEWKLYLQSSSSFVLAARRPLLSAFGCESRSKAWKANRSIDHIFECKLWLQITSGFQFGVFLRLNIWTAGLSFSGRMLFVPAEGKTQRRHVVPAGCLLTHLYSSTECLMPYDSIFYNFPSHFLLNININSLPNLLKE